jgi:predicted nucleic acid-binding protein
VIFIDSNIPMYLIGASHPNKDLARRLLEMCIERSERLVTDAEVLQEILHRYIAIRRRDALPAFNALLGVVDEVSVRVRTSRAHAMCCWVSPASHHAMHCTWPSCGVMASAAS